MAALILLNPGEKDLGLHHALFTGTAYRYGTGSIGGQMSIKTVSDGEASWLVNGRRFTIQPASWLLLNAENDYSLEIESATPTTTLCLFFRRGFFEDVAANLLCPSEDRLLDAVPAVDGPPRMGIRTADPAVTQILASIREVLLRPRSFDWTEALSRAALRIANNRRAEWEMANRLPFAKPATRVEVAKRIRAGTDLLLSHMADTIDTPTAAKYAGMSEFHFHRAFKSLHGQTPHRFLQQHRLNTAAILLRRGKLSVVEICLETGFSSLGWFTSLFTRRFGVSPGRFRQS